MKRIAILDGVDGVRHGRRLRFLSRSGARSFDELVDRGHRRRILHLEETSRKGKLFRKKAEKTFPFP